MVDLTELFRAEIVGFSPDRATSSFDQLGVDSFDLVSLRTGIEIKLGRAISDLDWMRARTPADIQAIVSPRPTATPAQARAGVVSSRDYTIGMPQMVLRGLSEPWLFKELGDIHWELISKGLQQRSAAITDEVGNRLYATFTRIKITNSAPLTDYAENDALHITGEMSRYGAGIFIGTYQGQSGPNSFSAQVMSSFSKRASEGSNKSLLKGQPDIPVDSPLKNLLQRPSFVEGYRALRQFEPGKSLFECDYVINPYTDINGVGLLYFAAYPSIADICELRFFGQGNRWAQEHSTVARDIAYFANSDASEKLKFKLLQNLESEDTNEILSLISRQDGTPMALISTTKKRIASR